MTSFESFQQILKSKNVYKKMHKDYRRELFQKANWIQTELKKRKKEKSEEEKRWKVQRVIHLYVIGNVSIGSRFLTDFYNIFSRF